MLQNEKGSLTTIQVEGANEIIKYMIVPIGVRRLIKMKFNNNKIEKIKQIFKKI
jgi:hypothetical protein